MVFHGTVVEIKPYPACIMVLTVNGERKEYEWTTAAGKYCSQKKAGEKVVFSTKDNQIVYMSDEEGYVDKPAPKKKRSVDDISANDRRIGLQSNINSAIAIVNAGDFTGNTDQRVTKVLDIATHLDTWVTEHM